MGGGGRDAFRPPAVLYWGMANPSLFRLLPAARRVALLTRLLTDRKELRAVLAQRMTKRGFRAVTVLAWPPAKLAQEVVRMNAQTADDELDLLQALYVDVEPQIQAAFLEAAKVKAEGAVIDESLRPPFADAEAVARAAAVVQERFGADGEHYLKTIARYNPEGWPGIEWVVAALGGRRLSGSAP